jgi:YHS domain-containing protein
MAKDIICGMTVDETTALRAERDGQTFYFCSEHCRDTFLRLNHRTAPRVRVAAAKLNPRPSIMNVAVATNLTPLSTTTTETRR